MSTALTEPVPAPISAAELADALSIRDLSDPAQGRHAMQLLITELTDTLTASWRSDPRVIRRNPVVGIEDNYERLGYPAGDITRDSRYTRYIDHERVLRSHTTAMIPPALDELAETTDSKALDVLLATPGLCYRRDAIDWQHTGTPQMIDLWRISTGRVLDDRDLVQMIGLVVATVLPGRQWRTVPREHPYTSHGRQIDVRMPNGERDADIWIEIGECGLAAPDVLSAAGLRATGLAMGLGLDRLLMLRKGIDDIRLLRSTDPRVTEQMLDLEPYRRVSDLPPVRRDLSIVVGEELDISDEAIGDRVRAALGPDADAVESVEVRSSTPYDELPAAARDRLGITPGQQNLLVRLVLRPLERTLTDHEANALRDRVYAALHEGSVHHWAAT